MAASAFPSSWSWRKTKPPATIALASSSPSPSPSQSQSPSPSPSPSTDSKTYKRVVNVPKLSTDEPRLLLPEKKALLSTPERVKWKERVRLGAQIESEKRNRSLKSLFGGRSLWRRVFSASKKVRSIILLNVITVVYASNIPVLKEVEAMMDPAAFTVVRFAVSAVPFLPSVIRARNDTHTWKAGTELGLWVSLGYIFQALGLLTSDAGRASFISMLTVIVVPVLDGMFGATVPPLTWFGAVLSVAGVAMLESSGSPPCVGDLFNFLSAIFFGIHMLRTERISRATTKENFIPLLGYEVLVVAILSMIWYILGGLFTGNRGMNLQSWTWEMFWTSLLSFPWVPAIYTGVFSTGLCLWFEMAAMRDVSATEAAIIYGLEPVWGAGFAWFLLGERWGTAGWIGAALILGGSLTVQLFGSLPTNDSGETESPKGEPEDKLHSNDQSGFSASPVVIRSEKEGLRMQKK